MNLCIYYVCTMSIEGGDFYLLGPTPGRASEPTCIIFVCHPAERPSLFVPVNVNVNILSVSVYRNDMLLACAASALFFSYIL